LKDGKGQNELKKVRWKRIEGMEGGRMGVEWSENQK
jgi:hypothetical protein